MWWLSDNIGSWSIASDSGNYTVSANTTYYVRASYTGGVYTLSASTDGSTWTASSSITNASKITGGSVINVGTAWENSEIYSGSIDLKDFYINIDGTEVWRAVEQGAPNKIETEPGEVIGTDYTVVGSATVSSDYIASNFGSSSYISAGSFNFGSSSWEMGAKIHTRSSISGNAWLFRSINQDVLALCVWAGNADVNAGNGSWYNGQVWIDSSIAPDADYWYKYSYDGTRYSVKRSTDGVNYTEIAYIPESRAIAAINTLGLGVLEGSGSFVDSIDLKTCYIKVDGTEVWRAVTTASDNWTNLLTDKSAVLKNITYQYPQGISESVSSLAAPSAYEQDLKGFVFFDSTGLVGYSTAYEYLPASDIAYTGYSYTLTDATATAITALQKTGTFCRVFFIPAMAGSEYVFVPVEDLQDGKVFSVGELKEKYSETNELPFRSLDTSIYSYTYDAFEDTLTSGTDTVLRGIGYAYAEWNGIAE